MSGEIDPAGTCHQVGCPQKGQHDPHGVTIGAGTWEDYQQREADKCLGYPVLTTRDGMIRIACSIVGGGIGGWSRNEVQVDPKRMAELVDLHQATCPNRSVAAVPIRGNSDGWTEIRI